jgi:uncharacterized protein (DUF2384 family)
MIHDISTHLARRLDCARAVVAQLETRLLAADKSDPQLAAVIEAVERVFDNSAARWWSQPAFGLDGRVPRDVALEGSEGCERVVTLLLRIEHGIYM